MHNHFRKHVERTRKMGENIIAGSKPTNVEKNHDNEEGLRGQALQRPQGKEVELSISREKCRKLRTFAV